MKRGIFCKICKFIECPDCFYKILRINKGIHTCPKYRHIIDRRIGKVDWKFSLEPEPEPEPEFEYFDEYWLFFKNSLDSQILVYRFTRSSQVKKLPN